MRLDKLNDPNRKDDVVTFEQLGIDRLFVDESHNYKNLFLYTKMRNVAGISQSEAKNLLTCLQNASISMKSLVVRVLYLQLERRSATV